MAAVFFCIVMCLLSCCSAYVNLALRKPASEEKIYNNPKVTAGNAVDGRKSNLHGSGGECSTSENGQQTATWWVNLESVYSIHDIRIYYRTDNVPWNPSNGYTARFLGFSIYVSNTTDKSDGTLCYNDTNFNTSTVPAVFNTTCFVHGQYVIYYNERLSGKTYPNDYSVDAFNDLCEVEVYGCPKSGYYGIACNLRCHDVNCRYCHIETGTCQGCKPGYKGHHCELECDKGRYGDGCQRQCGHCINITSCDHVNGTCLQGCGAGYEGQTCDQECQDGYFGENCFRECTANCKSCNKSSGVCDLGCHPGWKGRYCTEECTAGFFGPNCQENCTATCLGCSIVTGACVKGCLPGWKGNDCQYECDGNMYGENCSKSCGNCKNNQQCHNIDGTCMSGCENGYQGSKCDKECTDGFFGPNCQEKCNATCLSCNMFTGVCDKGCHPGWKGNYCQSACQDGEYGFECKKKCSPFCFASGVCHPKTGACLDGCKIGWTGAECFEVSVQDDDGSTSVLSIAALSVAILSIMINAVQLFYRLLLQRKIKRNKNKTYEQSKRENVFTHDISAYESVISRSEDNYQELTTVTADR